MRITTKSIPVVLVLIIVFSSTTIAQKSKKPFKGIITFDIQYPKSENEVADLLSDAPTKYTLKILGNKSKEEIAYGDVFLTDIVNGDNKTRIGLLEAGPNKYYYKFTKEEIEEELSYQEEPVVELLEETMTICGYICKKAKITTLNQYDEEIITIAYYTEDIGSKEMNFLSEYRAIDGLALRYETKDSKGKVTICTATEVKKSKIKDFEFLIPSDHEKVPEERKEEFKEMFSR